MGENLPAKVEKLFGQVWGNSGKNSNKRTYR